MSVLFYFTFLKANDFGSMISKSSHFEENDLGLGAAIRKKVEEFVGFGVDTSALFPY